MVRTFLMILIAYMLHPVLAAALSLCVLGALALAPTFRRMADAKEARLLNREVAAEFAKLRAMRNRIDEMEKELS